MCVTPLKRCAALDMYTATLRGLRIIASIPKAVPVVTVARTTITLAWGIYLSIAMGMAVAILMSMSRQSMMTGVVAMSTESMKITVMSMKRMNAAVVTSMSTMRTMNVAVVMSIITMSMRSMSTMNVAAAMSIMSTIMSMCQVIQRIVSAKFAILMRNIAISVAKA